MNPFYRALVQRVASSSVLAALAVFFVTGSAGADVASDKAAALLVFPAIQVSTVDGVDTLVQISNTSDQPINVHCFYVNANSHCTNSGAVCISGADCGGGLCLPDWNETDFHLTITARQPLIWSASQGLKVFPLDGIHRRGPNGQSNSGSRIPSVAEDPFVGELTCVAVDAQDRPSERNVLVGSAIIEQDCLAQIGLLDVTRENAIGIPAIAGANNGDNTLRIGEEYMSCPQTLILNHFFDGAIDPVSGDTILGAIALVPCTQDFLTQAPSRVTAQFLVFNEFEQRFSTSTPVCCYGVLPLSNIDTTQMERSIFHVGVAGTLSGQTRITGVGPAGHGLVGTYYDLHGEHSSAVNLHFQGTSDAIDVVKIP